MGHQPTLFASGIHLLRRDLVAVVRRGVIDAEGSSVLVQAVDECLHALADIVARADQLFQRCVMSHIEGGQLVIAAIQKFQRRVRRHVEGGQLVVVAIQSCQRRVLRHVDGCQLVIAAIQFFQARILRQVDGRELIAGANQVFQRRVLCHVEGSQFVAVAVQSFQCREVLDALQTGDIHKGSSYICDAINLDLGEVSVRVPVEIADIVAECRIGEVRGVDVYSEDAGIVHTVGAVPRLHLPLLCLGVSHVSCRHLVLVIRRVIGVEGSSVLVQAADECLHALVPDRIAVAVQLCQRRVLRHVERGQLVVVASQSLQRRVRRHIEHCHLVIVAAVQRLQFRVL